MLVPAKPYESVVNDLMWKISYDPKYKYYQDYFEEYSFWSDQWRGHEFVSLNSEGEVIGLIRYLIHRQCYHVNNLSIIHFTDNDSFTFAKDVAQAIDDIFYKYNFNKLVHSVYIGNPVEKTYDKLHKKYGGRIVGVFEKENRITTGEVVDEKYYEITRENYLKNRRIKNESIIMQ